MKDSLNTYWASREPREKNLLIAAAVLLCIALLYAVWAPLAKEQARLQRRLPQLQADVLKSQTLAARWSTLGGGNVQQDWRAAAQARLVTFGLSSQQAKLLPGAAGAQNWQFDDVAFNAFVDWLSSLYEDFGVRVKTIKISPQSPGQVSVTVELIHP